MATVEVFHKAAGVRGSSKITDSFRSLVPRPSPALSVHEVAIGPAGSRAMVRVSWGQMRCQNAHACRFLYFKYVLPAKVFPDSGS